MRQSARPQHSAPVPGWRRLLYQGVNRGSGFSGGAAAGGARGWRGLLCRGVTGGSGFPGGGGGGGEKRHESIKGGRIPRTIPRGRSGVVLARSVPCPTARVVEGGAPRQSTASAQSLA